MRNLKPIKSKLFKLLAKREHTHQELFSALKKVGYQDFEIEETISQAQNEGFINDYRFTENYIYTKTQRGYGPHRIEAELVEKGIDFSVIKQLMPEAAFWDTLAAAIREKRFGGAIPELHSEQAKQMRFLYSRGFDTTQIMKIFRASRFVDTPRDWDKNAVF